jgi:hypothetical protein
MARTAGVRAGSPSRLQPPGTDWMTITREYLRPLPALPGEYLRFSGLERMSSWRTANLRNTLRVAMTSAASRA